MSPSSVVASKERRRQRLRAAQGSARGEERQITGALTFLTQENKRRDGITCDMHHADHALCDAAASRCRRPHPYLRSLPLAGEAAPQARVRVACEGTTTSALPRFGCATRTPCPLPPAGEGGNGRRRIPLVPT